MYSFDPWTHSCTSFHAFTTFRQSRSCVDLNAVVPFDHVIHSFYSFKPFGHLINLSLFSSFHSYRLFIHFHAFTKTWPTLARWFDLNKIRFYNKFHSFGTQSSEFRPQNPAPGPICCVDSDLLGVQGPAFTNNCLDLLLTCFLFAVWLSFDPFVGFFSKAILLELVGCLLDTTCFCFKWAAFVLHRRFSLAFLLFLFECPFACTFETATPCTAWAPLGELLLAFGLCCCGILTPLGCFSHFTRTKITLRSNVCSTSNTR